MDAENNSPVLVLRLYVEKETGFIFEAQLFEKFVLTRHASPGMESMLRKLSIEEFSRKFEEFEGDAELVYRLINGHEPPEDCLYIN